MEYQTVDWDAWAKDLAQNITDTEYYPGAMSPMPKVIELIKENLLKAFELGKGVKDGN
jgi:hypothetical protein